MTLELNSEQRAAVESLEGPVLITAGAGSGKTRTLCERFVRATTDLGEDSRTPAKVDEVLAITFTDRAAGEIAERIRATLRLEGRSDDALAVDGAWISTIHGLCSRLLRRHALEAGVDPHFSVADGVVAEELKRAAFEAVATPELKSEEGRALFEEFGFEAIWQAVVAAASHALVLTEGPDALATPDIVPDAKMLLTRALGVFESAAGDVAACGSPTKTALQLENRCDRTYEALSDLSQAHISDVETVLAIVDVLGEWKAGTRVKALEEVQGRLKAEHHRLCVEAIDARDALLQRSLVRMTIAFRDHVLRLKSDRGLLDFDDLQTSVAELLDRRPDVLARIRSGFRLAMVDEFQDTDALQASIIGRLAGTNLCTVGDERQSIYGFRGADVGVYRAHLEQMRSQGARDLSLDTNYRSHPEVLEAINAIFADEGLFGAASSPLRPGRDTDAATGGPEHRVRIAMVDTTDSRRGEACEREATWVAEQFRELARVYSPGQMVVLVRQYTHAETYARALREAGLEAAVVGGSRLLFRPEADMVRALVRVIGNPHDEEALLQSLAGEPGRLTDDALALLALHRFENGAGGLWETLCAGDCGLTGPDEGRRQAFVSAIMEARQELGERPLADLVLRALERLDVDLLLLSRGVEGRQAFGNVLKIVRRIAQLETEGVTGPAAIEAHFAAMQAYGVNATPAVLASEGQEVVRVMSVHSSKGLEFPVVAAVGLDRYVVDRSAAIQVGRLPEPPRLVSFALRSPDAHKDRADETRSGRTRARARQDEAEEAARLFYVACTRAEDVLLLSGAAALAKPPNAGDPQPMSALRRVLFGAETIEPSAGSVERSLGETNVLVEILAESSSEVGSCTGHDDDRPIEADPGHESHTRTRSRSLSGDFGASTTRLTRFSYSDLALFKRCPLRFHAEKMLRLGAVGRGRNGSSPADFGSAVHVALQVTGSGPPDPVRLDAVARAHGLDSAGREELGRVVERFLESSQAARLSSHHIVRREWPFAVRIGSGDEAFDLVGSLDAYGRTGDSAMVIDYKTGFQEVDAHSAAEFALQAACYALAAHEDGCSEVRVEFVRLQVPDASGGTSSIVHDFTAEDLQEVREDLIRRVEEARTSDFEPLERWNQEVCDECPIARTICPVAAPPLR